MSYHDLSSCTLTDFERTQEKNRIMELLGMIGTDSLTPREKNAVNNMRCLTTISVKQLLYLRDLKDKCL